jgi:Tol biopolymer transport system component
VSSVNGVLRGVGIAALILLAGGAALFVVQSDGCSGYSPDISFSVSPDGHSIVFAGAGKGGQGIYTLNLNTLQVVCVLDTPDIEGDPAFMPDGRHIVYTSSSSARDAPSHVFSMSLDGRLHRQITFGDSASELRPSVSPDGKQIIFVRAHHYERVRGFGGSSWTQWTMDSVRPDGTNEETLLDWDAPGIVFGFAPNGKQLLLKADLYGKSNGDNLYIQDAEGANPPRPLTRDGRSSDPSFSPDGREIVYVADPGGTFNYDLAVMNMRTKKVKQLNVIRETRLCRSPVFTPDGKRILFLGGVNPAGGAHSGLYQVDRTGANLRLIAGSDLFYNPTSWRP